MNRRRKREILTIATLVLGVIVVALAYATLSDSLAISSTATVNPDTALFSVLFSTDNDTIVESSIVPTLNKTAPGFTATEGIIDNSSSPTVGNMHVTFTEPGQSVSYTLYAHNNGKYKAYLNSINLSGNKTCTPKAGTSPELVTAACNGIKLSVKVGNEVPTTTSISSISGHVLNEDGSDTITIVITYEDGSQIADGNFDVTLPSVVLNYDSAD